MGAGDGERLAQRAERTEHLGARRDRDPARAAAATSSTLSGGDRRGARDEVGVAEVRRVVADRTGIPQRAARRRSASRRGPSRSRRGRGRASSRASPLIPAPPTPTTWTRGGARARQRRAQRAWSSTTSAILLAASGRDRDRAAADIAAQACGVVEQPAERHVERSARRARRRRGRRRHRRARARRALAPWWSPGAPGSAHEDRGDARVAHSSAIGEAPARVTATSHAAYRSRHRRARTRRRASGPRRWLGVACGLRPRRASRRPVTWYSVVAVRVAPRAPASSRPRG